MAKTRDASGPEGEAQRRTTADLSDELGDRAHAIELPFVRVGSVRHFLGVASTLKVFEDNSLVRAMLETKGDGRVLVIDGGGSTRVALVGDNLARLAIDNGWQAIVVNGAIRDRDVIDTMPIAVFCLGVIPKKSIKRNEGQRGIPVRMGGVAISDGDTICGDGDGVLVIEG